MATALTVGATAPDDGRAGYSHHGPVVGLFAPGSGITAGRGGSDTATYTGSGTSFAAAVHLTGHPGASRTPWAPPP